MWVNLLARESLIHSHLLLLESVGNIRIKMSEANLQLVEGPFKDFTVRRIRPQDVDKVIQHIKEYFLHDEPPSKMLGYSDVYGDDFCHIVKYFLPDNLSLWMEHNETGEVAAVRSTFISKKGDKCWDSFPLNSRTMQILDDMHLMGAKEANVFERYGVNEYAALLVSSTHPKFRNQGLATEMYKRTLTLLKAEGVKVVKSTFTSPYSRAAVKRLGFEELCRVNWRDVKDKEGNFVFDHSQLTDEHYGAVMVKQL